MNFFKKYYKVIALFFLLIFSPVAFADEGDLVDGYLSSLNESKSLDEAEVFPVKVFLFHSSGCPHCRAELDFLETIKDEYPNLEIVSMEISESEEHRILFDIASDQYGTGGYIPLTVVGGEFVLGFNNSNGTGSQIKNLIKKCSTEKCSAWLGSDDLRQLVINNKKKSTQAKIDKVSLFGKNIFLNDEKSAIFWGIVLGLADGVNPCMFSVLIFLLTYLLAIGSRRKALKAGLIFAFITFLVYSAFMIGLIKIVSVFKVYSLLRNAVIVLAALAGFVMIKDYFFYGKWFSLEIPKKYKPTIEKLIKRGTIPSAIVLAIFSSLIELPCTSGLPLAYLTILSSKELNSLLYILWYNLFFVLPLFVIIMAVFFAWMRVDQVESFRIKYRKWMRLVAGILLVLLSLALWRGWI